MRLRTCCLWLVVETVTGEQASNPTIKPPIRCL
nr:MAG TPA: hypothetical protein [Caudoviricetes sp.]